MTLQEWVGVCVSVGLLAAVVFILLTAYRLWEERVLKRGHAHGYAEAIGLLPCDPRPLGSRLDPGAVYELEAHVALQDGSCIAIIGRLTSSQSWQRRVYCVTELPPAKFVVLEDGTFLEMGR